MNNLLCIISAGSVTRLRPVVRAVDSCVVDEDIMPIQRCWWSAAIVNITGAVTFPAKPAIALLRDTSASDTPPLWTVHWKREGGMVQCRMNMYDLFRAISEWLILSEYCKDGMKVKKEGIREAKELMNSCKQRTLRWGPQGTPQKSRVISSKTHQLWHRERDLGEGRTVLVKSYFTCGNT